MAESAIVVPVPAAEPLVGELRRRYSGSGAAGLPPHITLLYPFVDTEQLTTDVVQRAAAVIGGFAAFRLTLSRTRYLDWIEQIVLSLDPEPPQPFVALTEALVAEFPEHPPYGGVFDEIIPHLTVAMGGDRAVLESVATELGELSLQTVVEEAALFAHTPGGWRLQAPFPLATASAP
jgi:2'-5' RNA ligase